MNSAWIFLECCRARLRSRVGRRLRIGTVDRDVRQPDRAQYGAQETTFARWPKLLTELSSLAVELGLQCHPDRLRQGRRAPAKKLGEIVGRTIQFPFRRLYIRIDDDIDNDLW